MFRKTELESINLILNKRTKKETINPIRKKKELWGIMFKLLSTYVEDPDYFGREGFRGEVEL